MLTINDYNHIKLLYDNLLKMNISITELIQNNDWDSLSFVVRDKEILMNKIVKFEKPRLDDIKQNEVLNDTRTKLYELEKKNIELIKTIRESALQELKGVKKAKKVLNAYEPQTASTVSTFEISDDE